MRIWVIWLVTECCSESRMRSRTSWGFPELSGNEDWYIGWPHLVTGRFSCITGKVSGSSVVYRECREGCRGPSGGVSRPKGSHGLWEEINQPLVGWNKFPLRPIRFEKEKTQGGKSFQVGRWNPTPSRIGVGLLHLQFRPNLEGLRLPLPSPSLLYILVVLGLCFRFCQLPPITRRVKP